VLPDRDEFRYRLIGTLVTQYFNTDATGRTIAEAWASQGEGGVLSIMRYVVQHNFPMRVYGEADWNTIGLEKFDAIYLPLSDHGEKVNLILRAFVFDGPPGPDRPQQWWRSARPFEERCLASLAGCEALRLARRGRSLNGDRVGN
jgi:hypothetical protein